MRTIPYPYAAPWPHQTALTFPLTDPIGVDFFDDEEPGFVSIYLRYPDGTLWPARTVCMTSEHAESVLAAWSERGLVDHRTNRDTP